MSRLLSTEFRRFAMRQLVLVLVVAAIGGVVIGALTAAVRSHPPTASEIASAERMAEQDRRACEDDPATQQMLPAHTTAEEFCRQEIDSRNYYESSELELADLPEWLTAVSFLLLVGGLVLGASFVGADWHAGSMATLLTWEPRRIWVLVAKAIVCMVSVFVLALVLEILLALALSAVTAIWGITSPLPAGWFGSVAGTILRAAFAASLGSGIGSAIAMIGRNTAAALGILFAYLAIFEVMIRQLYPDWSRWLLGENLATLVTPGGEATEISPARAAIVIGVYVLLLLVAAGVDFRQRDVH